MASEHRGPEPTRALEPLEFMTLNDGHRTLLTALRVPVVDGSILGACSHLSGS